MSDLAAYEERRQFRIARAREEIYSLFRKYSISPIGADRQIEERFSQADYDAFRDARRRLYDEGGLG